MTCYYIKNYKGTAEIATYYTNNEFLPRHRKKLVFFRFLTKGDPKTESMESHQFEQDY